MKTPRDKYENDSNYRALVDTMLHYIEMAHFTPSELREAAILASIMYDQVHVRPMFYRKVENELGEIELFLDNNTG